ncbi:MAG: acyl carrier protein [Brevinematales bacterium]|nr:acyl carrier protein [Brevinematales bacterium]
MGRIYNRVTKIVSEQLRMPRREIDMFSYLIKDLGASETDLIEIYVSVESTFETSIPLTLSDDQMTVGHLVACARNSEEKR